MTGRRGWAAAARVARLRASAGVDEWCDPTGRLVTDGEMGELFLAAGQAVRHRLGAHPADGRSRCMAACSSDPRAAPGISARSAIDGDG